MTAAFKPGQELRQGVTLLEASAGTGKTYGITTLVLRLVAERGIPVDRILVVTYTNAATAELKVRIRRRLAEAVRVLRRETAPGEDEELALLLARAEEGGEELRRQFVERLEDAQQTLDAATISTIHGFCQRALTQNAFESGTELGVELEPDSGPLLDELSRDYVTAELHGVSRDEYRVLTGACGLKPEPLQKLAMAATSDPDMRILPELDRRQLEARSPAAWLEAVARFREAWEADADAALAPILDSFGRKAADKPLDGRKYQEKRTRTNRASLGRWLDSKPLPETVKSGWFTYFSSDRMRACARSDEGVRLASHPLFVQWDELLRLCVAVPEAARVRFAGWVRQEFAARNEARNRQNYQDLLRELALALADKKLAAPLTRALRGRYDAALIDEFQDTDALQWQIFSRLFGGGDAFLFLIGDPKQAIYGFRGANIHAYLAARGAAAPGSVFTMDTNYRSDAGLIRGLNHLLDRPGMFGETRGRIEYEAVKPCKREVDPRLVFPEDAGPEERAPLQLRLFDKALVPGEDPGVMTKDPAWRHVPRRVAADIVALLGRGARLHDEGSAGADSDGFRPLGAGDIAVLVRKHPQANAVLAALTGAGVPAVLSGSGNVLESDEAAQVQRWLDAISRAGQDGPARRAAATRLFGWSAADLRRAAPLDASPERAARTERWEAWLASLQRWRRGLEQTGFMRTFRRVLETYSPDGGPTPYERLLSLPAGERRLTNVLHLAELLHQAERERRLHPAGLARWLLRQRLRGHDSEKEAVELRLETDDEAVSVVTMHHSKGLEYPVVFAPYLWDGNLLHPEDVKRLKVPDPDEPTARLLDLHGDSNAPPKDGHLDTARLEAKRENLRLMYVTLTRARHRCVFYWGAVKSYEDSSLGAVLHGEPDQPGGSRLDAAADRLPGMDADALLADLGQRLQVAGPDLVVSRCEPVTDLAPAPLPDEAPDLACREFSRRGLASAWGQSSYTTLTRDAGHVEQPEDPDRPGRDTDQDADLAHASPEATEETATPAPADELIPVPLAGFPAGPDAGTCLHAMFEVIDFAGDGEHLRAHLEDALREHNFSTDTYLPMLEAGFPPVLDTPLGGPLEELRLRDIPVGDRLNELQFDLPVAGGHDWGRGGRREAVRAAQVAEALGLRHGDAWLPEAYLRGLGEALGERKLAGFMIGFIDLVFRARGRWYVADYKSNRLARGRGAMVHQGLFDREGMVREMGGHHYFLQYHLYTLALHRFLGQRLGAAYDYDKDMGGSYYLFIRGMTGPDTPWVQGPGGERRYHGVFFDRPRRQVIERLDRLFSDPAAGDGGES